MLKVQAQIKAQCKNMAALTGVILMAAAEALAQDNSSRPARRRLAVRIADPTWYTRGKIVPPGKRNPLGTRWLGLSRKGYGIHGTNRPDSIGRNASHGCIRMRNREVEELFKMVTVGDQVELSDERTPEIARLFGVPSLVAAGEPVGQ